MNVFQTFTSTQFTKTEEQIIKINGKDWFMLGGLFTIDGVSLYYRTAIYVTGRYDDRQYYQV